MSDDIRWCDQGCGYKLPEEYAENETTCGACLDLMEEMDEDVETRHNSL